MLVQGRYEIRDVIGKGGMGVVHRAWDLVVRRDVALKTIRDSPSREALDLFRKECAILTQISHPNIIEIFDLGEFEEDGGSKPYFVMPLLSGRTLDWIIHHQQDRLSVGRVIDIVCQVCRGLQAAHDRGLVHRDLKPSNVFVLQDDSVKIIDFGVAHMMDARSTIGHKGTLLYMSPEQIEMKPLTPLSDLFAVAMVCYEALTGRRPFDRASQGETVRAILAQNATPVEELNLSVNSAVSRVIHKAMAKQPRHRFASVRDFGDALQRALRNEPLDFLNPSRVKPRVERASRAYEQGDLAFASEILGELEAEGFLSTEISALRRNIEEINRRQKIDHLMKSAQTRLGEQEYSLALEKVIEILQLDPEYAEAIELRRLIENRLNDQRIEMLLREAQRYAEKREYGRARHALLAILDLRADDAAARQLLDDIDQREREESIIRREKSELFQAAVSDYRRGQLTLAESKLERALSLEERLPDADELSAARRQNLLEHVRSEREALETGLFEAQNRFAAADYGGALAIANEFLARYPDHQRLRELRAQAIEQGTGTLSARVAEVCRQVEIEPDLDQKIILLEAAAGADPDESYYEQALRLLAGKRDQVRDIVAKAQLLEELDQYQDALQQWETLVTVYPQYPGLSDRIARTTKQRDDQMRARRHANWLAQIRSRLEAGEWPEALEVAAQATAEFPGDWEFQACVQAAHDGAARSAKAVQLASEGRELCVAGLPEPGLARMRESYRLDPRNAQTAAALLENLVEHSRELLSSDWRTAEVLAREAVALNPTSQAAQTALNLALDRAGEDKIRRAIAEARTLQSQGAVRNALVRVEAEMIEHPTDPRLIHLRASLQEAAPAATAPRGAHPRVSPSPVWKQPAVVATVGAVAVIVLMLVILLVLRNLAR